MTSPTDPLLSDPPPEVHLQDAPLVRVIAQVQFPPVLSVERSEFVAPFQETLRKRYPVLHKDLAHSLQIGTDGIQSSSPQAIWRLLDADGRWRISLAIDFVSIETTGYVGRTDFLGRLRTVLEALERWIDPLLAERVGVRYINRLAGAAAGDIGALVIPEVRGILGTEAAGHARHSIVETLFERDDFRVLSRWGQLPPGATVDPSAIEPIDERSWILDLDLHTTASMPLAVDEIITRAESFTERAYALFRWAVTDELLRRCGGKP